MVVRKPDFTGRELLGKLVMPQVYSTNPRGGDHPGASVSTNTAMVVNAPQVMLVPVIRLAEQVIKSCWYFRSFCVFNPGELRNSLEGHQPLVLNYLG